jgi:hypothetical protein
MAEQPGGEISQLRRAGLVVVLAVAAATLPASPAAAANSLEGTCRLSGQFRFDEPLGNELRETGFRDHASGTCTGTLNGVPVEDAPVVLRAEGSGAVSCLAGHTTSSGSATFTRGTEGDADDVRIRFWTEASGGLTQFAARFGGAVSGQGIAYVNFLPYADESALAACQAGTLHSARYDLVTRTITPMVG